MKQDDPEALELRGTFRYYRSTTVPGQAEKLLAGAQRDLEQAVQLDSTRASAHGTLGRVYLQVHDTVAAERAVRRARMADPYLDQGARLGCSWRAGCAF